MLSQHSLTFEDQARVWPFLFGCLISWQHAVLNLYLALTKGVD